MVLFIDIEKLKRPTGPNGEFLGNEEGQCAEPKAARAASLSNSEIDGFDVVFRGKGTNNNKVKKLSEFYKEGDYEEMEPCATCNDPRNIKEYMRNANLNK